MSVSGAPARSVVATSVSVMEPASSPVARRIIDDSFAEEDDKTYVVSESDFSDESEDETGIESELDLDPESGLSAQDLAKNVTLVDGSCIALKDNGKATNTQGFQTFLLKHEIPRKIFHSIHGVVTVYLYTCGFSQYQIAVPLWAIFTATFLFEVVRLHSPAVNSAVLPYVKYLIRPREQHSWNGIVFYLAGVALVLTFSPKDIAVISILLLTWADTAASTVGRAWGKYTPTVTKGKSLAGCMGSFSVGVLVCYLFYGYLVPRYESNSPGEIFWCEEASLMNFPVFALATGLISSLSEAVDVAGIDDNFTLPVLSSVFLTALIQATKI